jgi:hypothetical protein
MDDQTVIQYRPTATEPITEPIYSRISFANIELNKWYYLTVMNLDYIVRPFIDNEYGITFAITQMLDREGTTGEWINMAYVYTLTPDDIDGDSIKLYNYVPAN